jgi:hypothetical protein
LDEERPSSEEQAANLPPEPASTPPQFANQPTAQQVVYQVAQPANGLAVAALVVGIVGLVLFWTVWGGLILGILGIVFGAVGISKANRGAPNKGMATAGLVLGAVALVASVLFTVAVVSVVSNSEAKFDQVTECVTNPDSC